ncbi:hypothetical protein [Sphingomonas sp. RIT328]|uniref:hypothetical protein n=1 Tax=Sphingomonas sp. RIT328 TaxID=1470591 RepID=UPI00044E35A9|nr:hypothetical protein [Sphingomonas sp. RIT328]EZP57262.1 hypothetical protein BW41_00105 [Sphingomonas sp. RIT328]
MDTGSPDLGVDFVINFGDSFGGLKSLDDLIGTTSANAVRDFQRIQASVASGLDLSAASAEFKALGATATRELRSASLEAAKAERAGESLVRQLERQNATYGKSRTEVRAMRVEEAALAAERTRNTDLAVRLRSELSLLVAAEAKTAQAAEAEAQAMREAAHAHDLFEAAARRGVLAMKEEEAALKANAIARQAQELREAAQAHDMFEARARAGVKALKEEEAAAKAASLAAYEQELRSAAFAHDQFEAAARRGLVAMREADAAAERDAATLARLRAMLDPAAAAQERLNREIVEARRVMTAAGLSAEDMARAESMLADRANVSAKQHDVMAGSARRSGFALQTIALQLPDITQGLLTGQKPMTVFIQQGFQIVQVAQMAEGGLRGFGKEVAGLALRFAPLLVGLAAAGAGFALFTRWVNQGVTSDQLTRNLGDITGGADATKQELFKLKDATIEWGDVSSALFSEVGKDIAKVFVGDMKAMGKDVKSVLDDITSYGRKALAGMYAGVAGMKAYLGEISSRKGLVNLFMGDPTLIDRTFGKAYRAADDYLGKLGARVKKTSIENARERNAKTIGFNNVPRPKTDHHAEQLAREAQAVEAQIRNLYELAKAYDLSGAAALIAEARVKAESAAIKKRGDIEAMVDREIRLSIAQRVSDASKSAAATREEARIQTEVNAMIAAGLVPAERANELVRDRIADLPLLAAIEAAQQRGLTVEVEKATAALNAQQSARRDAKAAEIGAFYAGADQQADRQLAMQREELRLVGATDEARAEAIARLQAQQTLQAKGYELGTTYANDYVDKQGQIAKGAEINRQAQDSYNASLSATSELFDTIDQTAQRAAQGMADAFGTAGRAIGDTLTIMTGYYADQARLQEAHKAALHAAGKDQARIDRENRLYSLRSSSMQIGAFGDMAAAAKGFFKEGSAGYQALGTAEKAFRTVQLVMSVRAIAQDAIETSSKIANSVARTAAGATEAVVNAIKSLPFPLNLAAGAATVAALASIGVSIAGAFGGSGHTLPKANDGSGTVLGDASAQSESLKRSMDALKEVDTLTNTYARQMAASLKSIDSQIGSVATLVVRAGDVNASAGVKEGFASDTTGKLLSGIVTGGGLFSKIPVVGSIIGAVGGLVSSLFGSKTTVVGSGLYGKDQSLGSVLSGGFDASYYSDIEKQKKFLGIKTGTSYSTKYSGADAGLENQFTLILRQFNDAIAASAAPLGVATSEVQARLNSFVVSIGKIDLKGLTGEQIQEKLSAVFGAAADRMASTAIPGIERLQKVGEGAFETLIRVASTIEAVGNSLDQLGGAARGLGIDAKLGLADQFDSVSDLTSAASSYFEAFYTKEEQAAAKTAEFARVFDSLGVAMPSSLAAFRALVDAQNLNTAAGQATYATLLKLAPAFADLQSAMEGAKSAADIAAERADLERQLLELNGDTAAIRALDLAKLDASNRALQQQVWALQDAQEAAKAAEALRDAWTSVGDSIMDEVKRIRGLTDTANGGSFVTLMSQFNAATASARAGDQDAAKSLPALSQALLTAAADQATSRQELARIQAQTAASLEATYGVVGALAKASGSSGNGASVTDVIAAAGAAQAASAPVAANDDAATDAASLAAELAALRSDMNDGLASIASNTGRTARRLDDVTAASSGQAIAVAAGK